MSIVHIVTNPPIHTLQLLEPIARFPSEYEERHFRAGSSDDDGSEIESDEETRRKRTLR